MLIQELVWLGLFPGFPKEMVQKLRGGVHALIPGIACWAGGRCMVEEPLPGNVELDGPIGLLQWEEASIVNKSRTRIHFLITSCA